MRNVDHIVIPPEIEALLEPIADPTESQLNAIGEALKTSRNEAVNYRASHGIESTWALCEDAYNGIDDANRAEYTGSVWIKANTMHAPLTTTEVRKGSLDRKSTAFVRLTSRYVDAGAAKIAEILLPIDDKAFSLSATPVPTLIKGKGDTTPVVENGIALKRPARPDEMAGMGHPPGSAPPDVNLTTKDLIEEAETIANAKAKRAETQIYDWMVECGHHHEMRKVIFDSARLGVGVLKGPFPDVRRRKTLVDGKLVIREDVVPVDKWVSPWNIFPDPACGENLRDGEYLWERDHYSEKQVRKLIGRKGYNTNQLNKVLMIGPGPTTTTTNQKDPHRPQDAKFPYEVWFFHGTMDKEAFAAVNKKAADGLPAEQTKAYVIATMINDLVVHATVNPLDSGDLPYHNVPWIRRGGFWAGVGVAEQISVPQRIVTAATRALLNNAGISAGPQIVINQKGIRPANQDWNLSPNKIWYLSEEGQTDDIRKAFLSFDINNVGKQLDAVIMYGMRLAEESTSIPLITQGMSGPTTPETLGATQLQNNNANQLLRYIGYSFDGYITAPLVNQYYEYLLLDPNVDDDCKGDFSINAQGSVALVERAIQNQFIGMMVQVVGPNAGVYGVNLKKLFKEWAKSNHLDPVRVQNTPEEQEKLDNMPPPVAPAIEVAKIKAQISQMQLQADQLRAKEEDALQRELAQLDAQITMEVAKLQNQTAQLKVKLDTDRDTAFVNSEIERARADFEHNMATLTLKKEIAQLEYAAKNKISVDQVKKQLATTAMQIQAQKELAAMDARLRVHEHTTPSGDSLLKPPAQLPGKAPNGKAFSQL